MIQNMPLTSCISHNKLQDINLMYSNKRNISLVLNQIFYLILITMYIKTTRCTYAS